MTIEEQLEPDATDGTSRTQMEDMPWLQASALVSIAISLKRLADAAEKQEARAAALMDDGK